MTSRGFHALVGRLRALAAAVPECAGRVVFLLEGGYDLPALGDSVAESFRALLGLPSADAFDPRLLEEEPRAAIDRQIAEAVAIHGL